MARDVARDWMWSEACEMLARAERMHRELFRPAGTRARQPAWEPPVDILETEFEVLAFVALPGVDADSVEAVIENGELVIGGARAFRPRIAHRRHSSARAAAGPLLPAAAFAGRPLQRRAPRDRRRMSGDYLAESGA